MWNMHALYLLKIGGLLWIPRSRIPADQPKGSRPGLQIESQKWCKGWVTFTEFVF